MKAAPDVLLGAGEFARVIYVDHYGNCMTGIRAASLARTARIRVGSRTLRRRGTFGDARRGFAFWYANSIGLVEIAANRAHAARALRLRVGSRVSIASTEMTPDPTP